MIGYEYSLSPSLVYDYLCTPSPPHPPTQAQTTHCTIGLNERARSHKINGSPHPHDPLEATPNLINGQYSTAIRNTGQL